MRPGIEPVSSWILVEFITAEPQWECLWTLLFFLLWLQLWHMEIPGLGVELELQLQAYATDTAMSDLSHIFDLHHSSWQRRVPNPLSEARD